MASFILWSLPESLVRLFPEAPGDTLVLWLRVQWTGISLISGTILLFALNFPYPSHHLERPWTLPAVFAPSAAFIALVWTGDALVTGIVETPLGPDAATGPLYPIGVSLVIVWLVLADVRMGRVVLRRRREPEGRAAMIVFFGLAHTHFLGVATDAILPVVTGINVRSGLASIYLLDLAVFVGYAVLRYHILVIEPRREVGFPVEPGLPLKEGLAHLVLCGDKGPVYAGFRSLASRIPALCVTSTPPAVVARRYGLDQTPVLWLTKLQGQPRALKPSELKFEVIQSLTHALRQSPSMAILVDDVDYLAVSVGFQDMVAFLKTLYDRCSGAGATLVVPLHPVSLEPRQVALLAQIFDNAEDLRHRVEVPLGAGARSLLALGSRAWCWGALRMVASQGRPLVVTPLHPAKYRTLVGTEAVDLLWVSEDQGEGSVPPTGLELGLGREVRRWMAAHPGAPVLVEGLEYLFAVNQLQEVVELVKGLVDFASVEGNPLVLGLQREAADARQVALLALRCEGSVQEKGSQEG